MTPFSDLLARVTADGEDFTVEIPADWMQGRTTYGGLSGALCAEATRRKWPDLPRLRSAQFAFVGPAGGPVRIAPRLLRQGKSSAFVGVDLIGADGAVGTRAILTYGAPRSSAFEFADAPAPPATPLDEAGPFFREGRGPNFSAHFDTRQAGGSLPMSQGQPEILMWLKHRDPEAGSGEASLIALADVSPPAAFAMFSAPAPLSTMTWGIDLLEEPEPDADWYLFLSRGDAVAEGYSSQTMGLWTASGRAVVFSRQTVAVFG